MPKYADSSTVRQAAHDEIETKFCDGHADDLHSSSTSLHLDGGDPNLQIDQGQLWMYHGATKQYRITKLSNITTDDRVFTPQGHIVLSTSVVKLYKSCTRALTQKLFRFNGKFDCANRFIKNDMSGSDFRSLPKIEADTWYPFYFKHSSELRGNLVFDKVLPPASGDGPTRRVSCVNVKAQGDLAELLPDGHVVYLGGEHDQSQLPNVSDPLPPPSKDSKYVTYRRPTPNDLSSQDVYCSEDVYISSPFPHTWQGISDGPNVALAMLRNGHYLYWGTEYPTKPDHQISTLPLDQVPLCSFWARIHDRREQFRSWPPSPDHQMQPLHTVFAGAWVMSGDCLVQKVNEDDYPVGVLERLRGGFFRDCNKEVVPNFPRVLSRLQKAKASIERYGGRLFGFTEKPGGIIECDIDSLATYLRLPPDALMSFIPKYASSHVLFRGMVDFLGEQEMDGVFEITQPLPVGPWMRGQVFHTGTGLLYSLPRGKYFNVELRNGVSWLSEYAGPGLSIRNELKLGQFIAGPYHA